MKKILGISILILLGYYGVRYHGYMKNHEPQVHAPLRPFVKEWLDSMKAHNIDVFKYHSIDKIMIVDGASIDNHAGFWKQSSVYISLRTCNRGIWAVRGAIWHELGHLVLGLQHQDKYCLMNKYAYTNDEYRDSWPELTKDYINLIKNGK